MTPKKIIALIAATLVVLVFPETVLLFSAGMIPTLVAYIIDGSGKKDATKTVGYLNAVGCFSIALDMWTGDNSLEKAVELLGDPSNWVVMFGSAAAGWTLYFTMRPIVSAYLAVTSDVKKKSLVKRQDELVKEWGLEVKGRAPQIPEDLAKEISADHANFANSEGEAASADAPKGDEAAPANS